MISNFVPWCKFFTWLKPPALPPPLVKQSELTLAELQDVLVRRGLIMYSDGQRLLFCSPRPILDDGLVEALQHHRPALLRTLPRRCA